MRRNDLKVYLVLILVVSCASTKVNPKKYSKHLELEKLVNSCSFDEAEKYLESYSGKTMNISIGKRYAFPQKKYNLKKVQEFEKKHQSLDCSNNDKYNFEWSMHNWKCQHSSNFSNKKDLVFFDNYPVTDLVKGIQVIKSNFAECSGLKENTPNEVLKKIDCYYSLVKKKVNKGKLYFQDRYGINNKVRFNDFKVMNFHYVGDKDRSKVSKEFRDKKYPFSFFSKKYPNNLAKCVDGEIRTDTSGYGSVEGRLVLKYKSLIREVKNNLRLVAKKKWSGSKVFRKCYFERELDYTKAEIANLNGGIDYWTNDQKVTGYETLQSIKNIVTYKRALQPHLARKKAVENNLKILKGITTSKKGCSKNNKYYNYVNENWR